MTTELTPTTAGALAVADDLERAFDLFDQAPPARFLATRRY